MRRKSQVAVGLVIAMTLAGICGCFKHPLAQAGAGSMSFEATINSIPSAAASPVAIALTLTMGGFEVHEEFPILDNAVSGVICSLAAGLWNVDAVALDGDGDAIYQGKAKTEVKRDVVTPLAMTLSPVPGRIRLEVSANGLPDADSASTAELWIYHAGSTSAYRSYLKVPCSDGLFVVEDSGYVPRSYDMRVVFLRDDGSTLYESDYIGLAVCPGKTTGVSWTPGLGSLSIDIGFLACPSAPVDVTVSIEDTAATVSWSPVLEDAVDHYRIYWRYSTYDRYLTSRSSLVESPASSAVVSLSSRQRGSQVRFVVVARDSRGQESHRSKEVAVDYR